MLVLASTLALSTATASARSYRYSHLRNSYNSMNMMRAPSYGYSYGAPEYSYGGSFGYSSGSSAGGGQLSGSAAENGGPGGGGGSGP
jgi:hypothetical protein